MDGHELSAGPLYLTKRQLARRTGLSESTIQRLKDFNKVPFFQPGGKGARVLYPLNAVEVAFAHVSSDSSQTASVRKTDQESNTAIPGPKPRWLQPKSKQ